MDGLSLLTTPEIISVLGNLGLAGLILVFHFSYRSKVDQLIKEDRDRLSMVLGKYEEKTDQVLREYRSSMDAALEQGRGNMEKMMRFYENNVSLVQRYSKVSDELSGIITLNTQCLTQLSESIKNNMYCPVIRERGPQ